MDGEQTRFAGQQRVGPARDRQDRNLPAMLGLAGTARPIRHAGATGHEGRALAHSQCLVEIRARRLKPAVVERLPHRITGRQGMSQRLEIDAVKDGIFEDLPVHGRHRGEQRRAGGADQSGPD